VDGIFLFRFRDGSNYILNQHNEGVRKMPIAERKPTFASPDIEDVISLRRMRRRRQAGNNRREDLESEFERLQAGQILSTRQCK
jgi:hypothetical protein